MDWWVCLKRLKTHETPKHKVEIEGNGAGGLAGQHQFWGRSGASRDGKLDLALSFKNFFAYFDSTGIVVVFLLFAGMELKR